ncbi:hypothetical protein OG905_35515 [Streptomyces sp. NBC_00322]|nr:hypothetical protein [Streptomyces sp. NBC_00322]
MVVARTLTGPNPAGNLTRHIPVTQALAGKRSTYRTLCAPREFGIKVN